MVKREIFVFLIAVFMVGLIGKTILSHYKQESLDKKALRKLQKIEKEKEKEILKNRVEREIDFSSTTMTTTIATTMKMKQKDDDGNLPNANDYITDEINNTVTSLPPPILLSSVPVELTSNNFPRILPFNVRDIKYASDETIDNIEGDDRRQTIGVDVFDRNFNIQMDTLHQINTLNRNYSNYLNIADKNTSQIDYEKRNKVKEVNNCTESFVKIS